MTVQEFKILRLEKGFKTQQSLSEWLGVSVFAVRKWECGQRKVPKYAVSRLNEYQKVN